MRLFLFKRAKYFFLAGAVAVFFLFLFQFSFFASRGEPDLKDKVKVASFGKEPSFLLYLARQKKIFEKYGIKVEIKEGPAGSFALDKLIEAEADIATVSGPVLVKKSFSRPDLRILSVISETRFDKTMPSKISYSLLISRQDWINRHPELAQRFMLALIEAERILIEGKIELAFFFKEKPGFFKQNLGGYRYYVYLPQHLLLDLEGQAAWQIANSLVEGKEIPNYLELVYPYALEAVDPLRVTMIR